MNATHACVWIDHREARIFGISAGEATELVVHDHASPRHIHRKADHVGLGKSAPDPAFFAEVAAGLASFKGVLIVGPGSARNELAGYLAEHHPALAKRIWGIEPMDHPTENQIVAVARKFFHAADRMHG